LTLSWAQYGTQTLPYSSQHTNLTVSLTAHKPHTVDLTAHKPHSIPGTALHNAVLKWGLSWECVVYLSHGAWIFLTANL